MTLLADVAVIGGGPAGAAAARLLASWGQSVIVLARAARQPPLAESLPPSCVKLLRRDRGSRGGRSARGSFAPPAIPCNGPTAPGASRCSIARPSAIKCRATVRRAPARAAHSGAGASVTARRAVRDAERDGDAVARGCRQALERETFARAWVLDCSGRAGVVARRGWRRPTRRPNDRRRGSLGARDAWPVDDDAHARRELRRRLGVVRSGVGRAPLRHRDARSARDDLARPRRARRAYRAGVGADPRSSRARRRRHDGRSAVGV